MKNHHPWLVLKNKTTKKFQEFNLKKLFIKKLKKTLTKCLNQKSQTKYYIHFPQNILYIFRKNIFLFLDGFGKIKNETQTFEKCKCLQLQKRFLFSK